MEDWKLQPARDLGLPMRQRWLSLRREPGLVETVAQLAWWSLVRGYFAVCHRLEIHGREHIPPEPPFVLVANHASHLDALALAAPLKWRLQDRIFPVAAGDTFFETPFMAAFAAGVLNALPIWRKRIGSHALEQLRERLLEEKCAYILFPEGTRTRTGDMASFKGGLGMLVAGTAIPVVPCYLDGAFEACPPQRYIPRFSKITVRIGEALTFPSSSNDHAGWRQVGKTAEDAVRQLAAQQLGRK